MKALSVLSLFLLIGCAASTQDLIEQALFTDDWSLVNKRIEAEEKQYAREDALTLAKERYKARLRACKETGGVMMIRTSATRLKKQYARHEIEFAQCMRW